MGLSLSTLSQQKKSHKKRIFIIKLALETGKETERAS